MAGAQTAVEVEDLTAGLSLTPEYREKVEKLNRKFRERMEKLKREHREAILECLREVIALPQVHRD